MSVYVLMHLLILSYSLTKSNLCESLAVEIYISLSTYVDELNIESNEVVLPLLNVYPGLFLRAGC
jgi:hypothetical protein